MSAPNRAQRDPAPPVSALIGPRYLVGHVGAGPSYAATVGHDTVVEDLIDAGDTVVARVRSHLSGRRSGIEGDQQYTQVTTFREAEIVVMELFWDHQEALEAAGLEE